MWTMGRATSSLDAFRGLKEDEVDSATGQPSKKENPQKNDKSDTAERTGRNKGRDGAGERSEELHKDPDASKTETNYQNREDDNDPAIATNSSGFPPTSETNATNATIPEDTSIFPPTSSPSLPQPQAGGNDGDHNLEPLWNPPLGRPIGELWDMAIEWSLANKVLSAFFFFPFFVLFICFLRSMYKCRKHMKHRREQKEFDMRKERANMLLGELEMLPTDDEDSFEDREYY